MHNYVIIYGPDNKNPIYDILCLSVFPAFFAKFHASKVTANN